MTYCYLRVPIGDFDDAVGHLNESAQIGLDLGLEEPRLFGLTHTANTLTYMTRFEEAWEVTQEARQLAETVGNRKWLAENLALPSTLHHMRNGDLDAASETAEAGEELATQIGAAEQEAYGAMMLGQIRWLRGDYEGAIACQHRARQAGSTAGLPYIEAAALCSLGTAYMDVSNVFIDQTDEFHSKAMLLMDMPLGSVMGAMAWSELGFCVLATGDVDGANALFQKGLTVPTAMKYLARPLLLIGSAFVALARNELEDAEKLVQEAQEFVEERAMKHLYPLVALADGQVSGARGKSERAVESFARGEQVALEMGMRPLVWQLRAGSAQVLSASSRAEEASAKRSEALDMIDEIAGLFQDEELRASYLESAKGKLA